MKIPPSAKVKALLHLPGFTAEALSFLESKGFIYQETKAYPKGGYYSPDIVNPGSEHPCRLVVRYTFGNEPFTLCFYENDQNAAGLVCSRGFSLIQEEVELILEAKTLNIGILSRLRILKRTRE